MKINIPMEKRFHIQYDTNNVVISSVILQPLPIYVPLYVSIGTILVGFVYALIAL